MVRREAHSGSFPAGVQLAVGDFDDPLSLAAALEAPGASTRSRRPLYTLFPRRRSPASCLFPPAPSKPTSAACTPNSARTAGPRRSRAPAPWACSRPPVQPRRPLSPGGPEPGRASRHAERGQAPAAPALLARGLRDVGDIGQGHLDASVDAGVEQDRAIEVVGGGEERGWHGHRLEEAEQRPRGTARRSAHGRWPTRAAGPGHRQVIGTHAANDTCTRSWPSTSSTTTPAAATKGTA